MKIFRALRLKWRALHAMWRLSGNGTHVRPETSGGIRMKIGIKTSALAGPQHRLLELMQRLNFGRIEGLRIREGLPDFDSPPQIVREIKIGGENGPRAECGSSDFALKAQVVELFSHLGALNDGHVICLEVKHGLPFRLTIVEPAR